MRRRKNFDAVRAEIREIVLAHARDDTTLGKAEVIADDCAYLIWRSVTNDEAQKPNHEKFNEVYQKAESLVKVRDAASQLYFAGCWRLKEKNDNIREKQMWENLRDALGLKPGTATKAGVGA